jgi:hypothetical protein
MSYVRSFLWMVVWVLIGATCVVGMCMVLMDRLMPR